MMKRLMRVTLTGAGICIAAGLSLGLAGYLLGGEPGFCIGRDGLYTSQDLRNRNAMRLAVLDKTRISGVNAMDIRVDYNNITVKPSGDDFCYLEYSAYVQKKDPEYAVKGGVLTLTCVQEPKEGSWDIEFFTVGGRTQREKGEVTVYVPKNSPMGMVKLYTGDSSVNYDGPDADTLDITSQYGGIKVSGVKADSAYLTASDGCIRCENAVFTSLDLTNEYGKTDLQTVHADRLNIESSDSRITVNDIVAETVAVTNEYGDSECKNVTADSLSVSQSDGRCSVKGADIKNGAFSNKYGDTDLELTGKEKEYNYDLTMKYGSISLNGRSFEKENVKEGNGADKNITVEASDGSIRINTR